MILKIDGRAGRGLGGPVAHHPRAEARHQDQPRGVARRQDARHHGDRGRVQGRGGDQDRRRPRKAQEGRGQDRQAGRRGDRAHGRAEEGAQGRAAASMVEAVDGAALAAGIEPGRRDPAREQHRHHEREVLQRADRQARREEAGGAAHPRRERHALHHVPPGGAIDPSPPLTVLSREYCHLCEDMLAALQAVPGPLRLRHRGGGRRQPTRSSRRSGATRSRCCSTASARSATTSSTSRPWMRGSPG